MKIFVINGTEVKGCTYAIKETFLATLSGEHTVEEIYLPSACPEFCTGCKQCFYTDISVCPHKEYSMPIWQAISSADLLVFTSPVYVFHATAQMKALLDHYATKWMAHSPEKQMFKKQAVIITCAAGAGMGNVIKDIGDSLKYWGTARVYRIKQSLFDSDWERVSEKRKGSVIKQSREIARKIKPTDRVTPSIGIKLRFFIMKSAQKMIHNDLLKKGQPETRDHIYWQSNGWLNGGKPWK
ncbi:MAG: NAD(P)H-dependent oxidoreductase [Oscillospiraceae bacterium]|nr:NAD(P)H-dependent oxidoreductase [Oscillospiraceae bacterium]